MRKILDATTVLKCLKVPGGREDLYCDRCSFCVADCKLQKKMRPEFRYAYR